MKKLKKISLLLVFLSVITSCESDVIINIYGVSEYNCTKDEYRVLQSMPMLEFLKTNKWYTREEFHEANYKASSEPYKDLPMSEETLADILPTEDFSNAFFNEFVMAVDCENPKDIKF